MTSTHVRPSASPDAPAAASAVLAQAGQENFPVALRVLPRRHRANLMAIYGFARLVDDTGDELVGSTEDRLRALDGLEAELDRAIDGTSTEPIFAALGSTIQQCSLAREPFAALIEANRRDQHQTSYATFDDLLGYCELSANPVGRLVLGVFGQTTPEREALSDLVCSGLQVVEHLQDVAEDAKRGRVYLPADDLARHGVSASDLVRTSSTPAAVRRVVATEAAKARCMIEQGAALVGALAAPVRLSGAGRLAVAGFVAGGLAQLDALERHGYDVLARQIAAPDRAVAAHALRLLAPGRSRSGFRLLAPTRRAAA